MRLPLLPRIRGATTVEYIIIIGVVVLAALAGFAAFGRSSQSLSKTHTQCVESMDCAAAGSEAFPASSVDSSSGEGAEARTGSSFADAVRESSKVLETALSHVVSFYKGVLVDGLWGTIKDIGGLAWDLVTSPVETGKALGAGIKMLVTEPGAVWQMIKDDYKQQWQADPARTIGNGTFQVVSTIVPLTKVGALGKLGKLGRIGKLGKAGKAAEAAKVAEDAAKAARAADEAADAARAAEAVTSGGRRLGDQVTVPRSDGSTSTGRIVRIEEDGTVEVQWVEDGKVKYKRVHESELREGPGGPRPARGPNEPFTKPGDGYVASGRSFMGWNPPNAKIPDEGWKLHVSADPARAHDVADEVLPKLREMNVPHKIMRDPGAYEGMTGTQTGKFITIYPENPEQAAAVARALDERLAKMPDAAGPTIPGEKALGDSGMVYTRYGGFTSDTVLDPKTGQRVPDDFRGQVSPPWITDPFQ